MLLLMLLLLKRVVLKDKIRGSAAVSVGFLVAKSVVLLRLLRLLPRLFS
jgi:hypothetical protein